MVIHFPSQLYAAQGIPYDAGAALWSLPRNNTTQEIVPYHTSAVLKLELFVCKKRSRGEEFLSQEHMENLQEPAVR